MGPRVRMVSGAALDIGRNPKRSTNQDRLAVFEPLGPDCPDHLYLVCDGMGGHQHGETASALAAEEIPRAYRQARKSASVEQALRTAIERAHAEIKRHGRNLSLGRRMGTTAVVGAIEGQELVVANVGDSRAYIVRGDQILQISMDHSRAAEVQRRSGEGEAIQIRVIGRNVLTRSLSAGRERVEPDIFSEHFREGDVLILCSDGLWSCVADASILHVVSQLTPSAAAKKLVSMANRAGGPDNISVIVVRKGEPASDKIEDDTGEMRALSSQPA